LLLVFKANPFLNKKQTKVIYNIVDFEKFKYRERYPQNDKINIVIVASYLQKKNPDNLVKAVNSLTNNYKDKLKVEWFGNIKEGNYYKTTKDLVETSKLSEIIYLNDKTNKIENEYIHADFVGLFSHYEGFPNTICEAMALGIPVIVTKVSDVPQFVKEDENGFLCESNKVETIKLALIKAIDSSLEQRKLMGDNNYKLAKQEFNKEVIVEQYLKLFENES
jgi:glycosyltransferase involved in cell wall biosynthesis